MPPLHILTTLLPAALVSWLPAGLGVDERDLIRILVVLLIAAAAMWILGSVTRRVAATVGEAGPSADSMHEQRVRTLVGLVQGVGVVFIALVTLFMILQVMGVNVAPLLAAAGVFGLAVSFGAQSLVKDVISGLFMLWENQFGVGDVIRVGENAGLVEKVTLRVVVLRDIHGTVHIIPNGEIKQISNLTRSWSRAVLEIGVAYKEDVDRVMEVMREVGREMWEDEAWRPLLLEEMVVPGVESFGDSAVVIRMMAKTLPLKQWDTARELRRRLKNRFDAEGIQIPFPHRTFYWGKGQAPADAGAASSGAAGKPQEGG